MREICIQRDNENFSRFSCMYSKRHVFSMLNRECAYRVVKTLFEDIYYARWCLLKNLYYT